MIYIAAPYSHNDKSVVKQRVKMVCEYSADLLVNKKSCISPITVGTGILSEVSLPTDFEFWQNLSYDLLDICSEMHVLMIDGWKESIGVQAEIKRAILNKIPVKYFNIYKDEQK